MVSMVSNVSNTKITPPPLLRARARRLPDAQGLLHSYELRRAQRLSAQVLSAEREVGDGGGQALEEPNPKRAIRNKKQLEDGWPERILQDTQPESVHFSKYAFHCLLCAGFYASHCLLSLRMHLCTLLCTCVLRASMNFTVYFPCARLYAFQSTFPCMHLCALYLPYACLYALHCLLSLGMPLGISLSTFPVLASMCCTVYFPCIYALHPVLCVCLYAFHCLLSLYVPLCISLSTFPVHASMHFTLYLPFACLYAFHCLLSLCMPLCISLFTLCVPQCSSLSTFPRMPLCISLSTFPVHVSVHVTLYLPIRISLCTFSMHAFMYLTVYFPYAVELCRTQRLYRKNPFAMLSGKTCGRVTDRKMATGIITYLLVKWVFFLNLVLVWLNLFAGYGCCFSWALSCVTNGALSIVGRASNYNMLY